MVFILEKVNQEDRFQLEVFIEVISFQIWLFVTFEIFF